MGDSFHRLSNPDREAHTHNGFRSKTSDSKMVLINRTNEANIRQLDSLAICRKGMTLREQSRTKLTTDNRLIQLHS